MHKLLSTVRAMPPELQRHLKQHATGTEDEAAQLRLRKQIHNQADRPAQLDAALWRFNPRIQNRVGQLDAFGRGQIDEVRERAHLVLKTAVVTGTGLGMGLVPQGVAELVIMLTQDYGAFRTLNVRPAFSGKTKFPLATALPSAVAEAPFLTPANQGTAMTPVATILGSGFATESRDLPILLEVALPLLEDDRADWAGAATEIFAAAIAARIDHAAFAADGTDDVTDGGMTGIFAHGDVPAVAAAAGRVSVEQLQAADLLTAMDAIDAAAMQRGARWWVHPTLYRKLLRVNDSSGAQLVKFEAGQSFLLGHPITLVAAAPASNAAGAKVLAFGCGEAYLVALREELGLEVSDSPKFNYNIRQFRATARLFCGILDASWFATLALAAV